MEPRHVWFVNHHALIPSKDGGTGRHLKLARVLPRYGWTATLIVASTRHPEGSQALHGRRLRRITSEDGVPALWVRSVAYGKSTVRRFIGMAVFAAVLLLPGSTRGLKRPDIVLGSTVHLLAAWAGLRLARRRGVPFVFEIRDVWPETLIDSGAMRPRSPVAKGMRRLSAYLAQQAALVVSPLPRLDLYLQENGAGGTPFLWVSNGFDGPDDAVADRLPESDVFTFMYLGSHGTANALETVLEAFDDACKAVPNRQLALRMVGAGPAKSRLIEHASRLDSGSRISFEERIPEREVIARAREADALVANMFDWPVYRYGISLNKLFAYLSAQRPVIFASNAPNNPVEEAGAGIVVPANDREALAAAMVELQGMPAELRERYARSGFEHVATNYSPKGLARALAEALDNLMIVEKK